jgi:hypothetical protein
MRGLIREQRDGREEEQKFRHQVQPSTRLMADMFISVLLTPEMLNLILDLIYIDDQNP